MAVVPTLNKGCQHRNCKADIPSDEMNRRGNSSTLQKASTSKESKPKNENRTEDIERWLKDIHEVVDKDIVQDNNNEKEDDIISLSDYLSVINKVVKYTENAKSGRDSKGEIISGKSGTNEKKEQSNKINNVDLEDEHMATLRIKNFCKLMGVISLFEKLKSVRCATSTVAKESENANANANGSGATDKQDGLHGEEARRHKAEVLEQNGVWTLLEEIILNSAEYLNKIICLDKDMFQKKCVKINCNKLKRYINYLNLFFEETNKCQLLFRILHLQLENSKFITYELVLLLQKLYIYDNVNFYLYVHHNIAFSNHVSSPYYYNLYGLRCFQILFHDRHSNMNGVNLQEQQKVAEKIYERYKRVIHNLRRRRFFYPHLISYPFNCSEEKLSYKKKNENYYINDKDEFCSIKSGKIFSSALFLDEEDAEIRRLLKKLHHEQRWDEFHGQYDSFTDYSASSNEQSISDHALQGQTGRMFKEKGGCPKSDGAASSPRLPSSCSSAFHEVTKQRKKNNSNENLPSHSSTDEDNQNEESSAYFSSDISNEFITIQNVRNTIDKLILSKNHFLSKLLAIVDSNEDAYLINEVILLLLLVSEYSAEVRNIITYERFIETVIRIIQDEHTYLFKPISDLYFLYDDGDVVVPRRKTKISPHPTTNRRNDKREEMNHTQVDAMDMIAFQTEKPPNEQNSMEIYLDNISINIDLKSSLLLLKCLIMSSEFGLKYIYELNIFDQFIKLVLNMYNVIIYIFKNDMKKYFSNSIFVLNIFLDILASSCKVEGVNSYTGLSCTKFLLILQKERFFESSFFFFFKFMCIYMEKYANDGRRPDQLGHRRNEDFSNYDAGSDALIAVDFSRDGNAPLPGGSNSASHSATAKDNISLSASIVFPNSESGGGHSGSTPVGASIGSNFPGSSQTGNGQGGGFHFGSSMHSQNKQIMQTFKNTHFVGILNMCCKFLLQDESLCVRVLLTSFDVGSGGEESSQLRDEQDKVNSFVNASLKQTNYFHLEQVLAYYMKHLKQIKYADLLLIMFLYDRKRVFCNTIYEFFYFLGGKHAQVGKYLMESLLSRGTVFNYCVMHTVRRVSKLLLKMKEAFQRGEKRGDLLISEDKEIPQKEKFFLKYMNLSNLLLKVCNLTSSNNPDEALAPIDEFLSIAKINFEQMMYYSALFTGHYNGVWKQHIQRKNEDFSESVLTFRINSILYRKNFKGQMDSVKFLIAILNNKWGCKKNRCLICVYIAIYLFKSNEEKEKRKIVKLLIQNDLFNIMYNCLNRFCKFTFDEKYFFFVSFEKCKNAHENIKSICNMKKQKYFFNYSREISIFCIHYVYSNFIHHSMLTYFFEQSKGSAYGKDPPRRNRSGYLIKRSHSSGDPECMMSESEGEKSSQGELDGEVFEFSNGNDDDYDMDASQRKKCEDYSLDEDNHSNASSEQQHTRQARKKNEVPLFYSKGGEMNGKNYVKSKAKKTKAGGVTRGRRSSTQAMAQMSEDVSHLREKLNEQEVTHLEEKIYLNKIIEKKNDIINNMMYAYSMMKEKCEQVESELVQVRIDLGLKEKECQVVAVNDMDDLKIQHMRVLRDYEKVGSEKRELETKFEKLTDLLIFLYENVPDCRQYMQNVEDVDVFKNPRIGENKGGDLLQPNSKMCKVGPDDHLNAEVKVTVDTVVHPNEQLNRSAYEIANDQVWGIHNGCAYANLYNPVQQNFTPQGYQNSPYEDNAYTIPQQEIHKGNSYSYSNQQINQGSSNNYPPQQMQQSANTYGYPPEPVYQVHSYSDPNPPAEGNSSQRIYNEVNPPVMQPPSGRQYEQQYGQVYEHAPLQMYNELYYQTNPHVYPHLYVESTGQNASASNAELNVPACDRGPNGEGSQGQPSEQNGSAEFAGQ
ncbi:Uncharacterized protein PKNOH_S01014000 [Plasmodium knowlesi]|uniref:Uncharacterized protein n=1 Tax=Plasmodium knowlesi TaxID=5850 RepID=A0A1Y3DZ78_PLAKN|nr:Uncharacterized protein PKNOH_S01014000 [Plasmodium knowlesi]